jgi:hypothetical protein
MYVSVLPKVDSGRGCNAQKKIHRGTSQIPLRHEDPGQWARLRTFLRTIAEILMPVGTMLFNNAHFVEIISSSGPSPISPQPSNRRPKPMLSLIAQTPQIIGRSVGDALCDLITRRD